MNGSVNYSCNARVSPCAGVLWCLLFHDSTIVLLLLLFKYKLWDCYITRTNSVKDLGVLVEFKL